MIYSETVGTNIIIFKKKKHTKKNTKKQ